MLYLIAVRCRHTTGIPQPVSFPTTAWLPSMFSACRDFTIQAGNITHISNSAENSSDYRTIPWGDVRLLCQVVEPRVIQIRRGKGNRVHVVRERQRGTRKTTYHARIIGIPDSNFTVMAYSESGPDFSQWKSEVEANHQHRHPHLFQLFGMTHSHSTNSAIFHDELIPIREAISKFPTHLTRVYSVYVLGMQFQSLRNYCNDHVDYLNWINDEPSSEWFCLSTGSLSVERSDQLPWYPELKFQAPDRLSGFQTLIPSKCMSDSDLMRTMHVEDLLAMIQARPRFDYMPDLPRLHKNIYLGAVYSFDTPDLSMAPRLIRKILSFPTTTEMDEECPSWRLRDTNFNLDDLQQVNFMRIGLHKLQQFKLQPWQKHHSFDWYLRLKDNELIKTAWLTQANLVFVTSPLSGGWHAGRFALTTDVRFTVDIDWRLDSCLRGTFMADEPTNDLFLFLANPKVEIENGILTVTLLEAENAFYWSFESDGSIALTPEELEDLSPPEVMVRTYVGT
ncbi:hypothetical protein FB451DRAFT_1242957 [Mycena latifolia]|nr:hypothetical protein FB451DRAFT_1242957 [Mycena latifolia]